MSEAREASEDEADPQAVAERAAQAMAAHDVASESLGIKLERVAPGEAEMSMTVRADMLNGFGNCHGGYIFTLADSTFAFACNSHDKVTVAAAADISFLAPVEAGETLTARAREAHLRGRSGVYDVEVTNSRGEVVALFRGKSRTIRGQVSAFGAESS